MDFKFKLLLELRDICRENDIDMFLSGILLRAAYAEEERDYNPDWDYLEVLMPGPDFEKLNRIVNNPEFEKTHPNRKLESLYTNPKFPGFFAKFVATDSLYLNLKRRTNCFDYHGLAINISILTGKMGKSKKKRFYDFLQRKYTWLRNVEFKGKRETRKYRFWRTVFNLSKGRLQKFLLGKYTGNWNDNTKSRFFSPNGTKKVFLWKHFAEGRTYRRIGGEEFLCPDRLFRRKQVNTYYSFWTIHSDVITFDEFMEEISRKGLTLESVTEEFYFRRRAYSRSVKRGRKLKRYYNAAFYSTMLRHEVSDKLLEVSDLSLENEEYYEILEDFLNHVVKHSRNGITPFISPKIFLDCAKIYIGQCLNYGVGPERICKRLEIMVKRVPLAHFDESPITDKIRERTGEISDIPAEEKKEMLLNEVDSLDYGMPVEDDEE